MSPGRTATEVAPSGRRRPGSSRALRDLAVLVLLVGVAAVAAVRMGVDRHWDLMNYHLYGPLAFLNGRILSDVAAGLIQGYFVPTADFLTLFLFRTLNDHPIAVTAIYGALHGVNFFLVYKIAGIVFAGRMAAERGAAVTFSVVFGATGAVVVSILGTTTNDLLTSIPCLVAVLCLASYVQAQDPARARRGLLILGGVALGVACGLKYTMAVYALALGFALLVLARRRRALADVLLFSGVAAVALAASVSYHVVFMTEHFGNPLFPNLNDVFRSPHLAPSGFRDVRFVPNGVLEALAYPLHWAAAATKVSGEVAFRDARFAVAGGALLIFLAACAIRLALPARLAGGEPEYRALPRVMVFLVVFWVASFLLWVALFGISRYLVTADLLAGIILAWLLLFFLRSLPVVLAAMAAILALLAATTVYVSWGREPHGDRFIHARFPDMPARASLFLAGDLPLGFLAAFLPVETRIYRLGSFVFAQDRTSIMARRVAAALADAAHPRYLVLFAPDPAKAPRPGELPAAYRLDRARCARIENNMASFRTRLWLCPVVAAEEAK